VIEIYERNINNETKRIFMKAEYGCVAIAIIFAIIVTILFVIFTESCITPFFLGINDVTYRMI